MSKPTGELPEGISKFRDQVAKKIKSYSSQRDGELFEMIRYHLGSEQSANSPGLQGKAIRSSLLLFITEGLGGDFHQSLPAAISLELIHNFSLVHDDIQDNDFLRRGRESVHAKWGSNQAINAGDGLRDLATLALIELSDGPNPELTLKATKTLGSYSLRMISGQVRDLQFMEAENITMDDYLSMIGDKTCALLEASFHLGGIYAGASHDTIDHLTRIAKLLGYIFQVRDDWLGIWGKENKFGKPVKSDLIEKKRSFPIVYAFENGSDSKIDKLKKLYFSDQKLSDNEVSRVNDLLNEIGAKEKTNEWLKRYWDKILEQINEVNLSNDAQSDLIEFGKYLLKREA